MSKSAVLGSAILWLKGDNSDLLKKLEASQRAAAGAFKSMGNAMQSVGRTSVMVGAAITAVTATFAVFIGKSVAAANEAEAAEAQLDAALKSTGQSAGMSKEALVALAEEMQKLTVYDDDAIISLESLMLTFTGITKDIFPQAAMAIADVSTRMGNDLQGAAIQVGKALNDPVRGMSALTKVGVAFTEQQREQITAMVQSGDVMGAQKIILAELAVEFGGSAAAAAATFGGRIQQVKNQMGNLMEEIGNVAKPALISLVEAIEPVILRSIEWFRAQKGLGEQISKTIKEVVETFLPVLKDLWKNHLVPIVAKVWEWVNANPELTVKLTALTAVLGPLLIALGTAATLMGSILESTALLIIATSKVTKALMFFRAILATTIGTVATLTFGIQAIAIGFAAFGQMLISGDWTNNFITDLIDIYLPKLAQAIDWVMDKAVALKNALLGTGLGPEVQLGEASKNAISSGRVSASGSGRDSLQSSRFGGINIHMGGVVVREEADISKIAIELGRRVDRSLRSRGALA